MSLKVATNTPAKPRRVVRHHALPPITGLSTATIYRLIRAGKFPQSFPLSEHAVGFDLEEIEAWVEARKAARQEAVA